MTATLHTHTHAAGQMGTFGTVPVQVVTAEQVVLQPALDFNAPEPLTAPLPSLPALSRLHEGYWLLGLEAESNTVKVFRPKNAAARPENTLGPDNSYTVSVGLDQNEAITATGCECVGWHNRKPSDRPCRHGALVEAVAVWIATLKHHHQPKLSAYRLGKCYAVSGVELLELIAPYGASYTVARLKGSNGAGYVVDGVAEALRWAGLGMLSETGGRG